MGTGAYIGDKHPRFFLDIALVVPAVVAVIGLLSLIWEPSTVKPILLLAMGGAIVLVFLLAKEPAVVWGTALVFIGLRAAIAAVFTRSLLAIVAALACGGGFLLLRRFAWEKLDNGYPLPPTRTDWVISVAALAGVLATVGVVFAQRMGWWAAD